jgi:hypothetical protein
MLVASVNGITPATQASLDSVNSGKPTEVTIKKEIQNPKTVKETVDEYFKDTPTLSKVAFCESRYRQVDGNGEILRGVVNSKDVGVMQINEDFHSLESKKLGMDIHTLDGNLKYAKHLYDTEGLRPWASSSKCWNKGESIAINKN